MRELTVVNLNEYVEVELTKIGKEMYFHQYDKINSFHGKIVIEPTYPKLEQNGRLRLLLWELFEIFGQHFHHGMDSPFVDNILYLESEV